MSKPLHDDIWQHHSLLTGIAYRMLGERNATEDAVQDAYLRLERHGMVDIRDPKAWLIRTLSRLCIDKLRALKRERAVYDGPWLPEPWMMSGAAPQPDEKAELADSLRLAFLLMLEELKPDERAAFLLREAFDVPYGEIADILDKSESACRQIVSRARKRVQKRKAPPLWTENGEKLLKGFLAAAASGNLDEIKAMLTHDVELWSDGGGKATSARNILTGNDRVSRFLHGIFLKRPDTAKTAPVMINGEIGLLITGENGIEAVFSLAESGGKISGIYAQRNPDKLAKIGDPAPIY